MLLTNLFVVTVLISGLLATSDELWQHWKQKYQKHYGTLENEKARRAIWEKHVNRMQQHNLRFDLGLETYKKGLNQFSDLEFDEIRRQYSPIFVRDAHTTETSTAFFKINRTVPDRIDWRHKGLVRAVKNQGECVGSAWAFATTGVIEGQYMNTFGDASAFSEQQLIECSYAFGNNGCKAGHIQMAYNYLKHYGLEEEMDYVYVGKEGRCHFNYLKAKAKVTSYYTVNDGDENKLRDLVGLKGPTVVVIQVTQDFFEYRSGIFQTDICDSSDTTHTLLVVGYNQDDEGEYWILKNSWGRDWGEDGFIRMVKNYHNMCGIASHASIPMITSARPSLANL